MSQSMLGTALAAAVVVSTSACSMTPIGQSELAKEPSYSTSNYGTRNTGFVPYVLPTTARDWSTTNEQQFTRRHLD